MNPVRSLLGRLVLLLQHGGKARADTPADAAGPTRTLAPGRDTPTLDDLASSVAGEEDPGAALDAPAPPPRPEAPDAPGAATRR